MILCYGSPSKLTHPASRSPDRNVCLNPARVHGVMGAAVEHRAGAVLAMDPKILESPAQAALEAPSLAWGEKPLG